ncbi:MAG: enoyl-CoA hydratase-related protein, partial [Bradymonadaceae bacterium]
MADDSNHPLVGYRLEDGIAYLDIDVEGEPVNTLSPAMTGRFEELLDGLGREAGLEGVVLHSSKPDNFIAGFDIEKLRELRDDADEMRSLIRRGHRLMSQFEELDAPIVAAVDGSCLGGGLEVALACSGRVAADTEATSFGFPEVKLGVIPGLGGTQRLPRVIDPQLALKMILTGKEIDPDEAHDEGLVEDVVHPGILLDRAADLARQLNEEEGSRIASQVPLETIREFVSDPTSEAVKLAAKTPARKWIFDQARETTRSKAGDDYPAPFRAIDVIETGFEEGFEAGIEAETEAFVDLVQTDVAEHLIEIFFTKRELENDP